MQIHADLLEDNDKLLLQIFFDIFDKATNQTLNESTKVFDIKTNLPFTMSDQFLSLCKHYLPQIGFEISPYDSHIQCLKLIVNHLEEEDQEEKNRHLSSVQ